MDGYLEDSDEPLAVGGRHGTAPVEDRLQLVGRDLVKVQLDEAVAEGAREQLAAAVLTARRVLRGEQQEARVGPHRLLCLGDEQLAVVVQQPVERLEHLAGRQIQFVEDEPVAAPHGVDEDALAEDQLARLVGRVGADVLLQIRVLVVVDADALVARQLGQVADQRRFAHRRFALQQHRQATQRDDAHQVLQVALDRVGDDVRGRFAGLQVPLRHPVALDLDERRLTGPKGSRLRQRLAQHRPRVPLADDVLDHQVLYQRVRRTVQLRQETQTETFVQRSGHRSAKIQGRNHERPAQLQSKVD